MLFNIVICVKRTAAGVLLTLLTGRVNNLDAISLYSKTAQTYRSWEKGSNKRAKKVFIVEQILLVSTKGNVWAACYLRGFIAGLLIHLVLSVKYFLGLTYIVIT